MKPDGIIRSCPVCGTSNDAFAVVCVSCKGYIQAKVDTLDLFSTMWGLMEAPSSTFRRIALAGTKNYVVPLAIGFGVALMYALLWNANYGVREPQLLTIIGTGLAAGLVLGPLLFGILARVLVALSGMLGRRVAGRDAFALFAYAAVPVVITLVIVFPVEIAIFGVYLFDNNPPPIVMNPVAYIVLVGLDMLAAVWSTVLLAIGLRVMTGAGWVVSALLAAAGAAAVLALFLIPLA